HSLLCLKGAVYASLNCCHFYQCPAQCVEDSPTCGCGLLREIAYKRKKKLNGVNIPNAAILAAYLVFVSLCVSVRTDWWEAARYDGTGSAMPVEDPEV
ncbi:Hypothetical predicted protein, partial [Pelobates cultripes]